MQLETERLVIELAKEEDAKFIFRLLNSPNWLMNIGDRGIRTEEDAKSYIDNSLLKNYRELGFGLYKVSLKNGSPVGICGFVKRNYLDSVDIGFATLPEYEGQGYTFEAAKAIFRYGKSHLGFTKIFGITSLENIVSQHLLSKLGLKVVGKRRDREDREMLVFSSEEK